MCTSVAFAFAAGLAADAQLCITASSRNRLHRGRTCSQLHTCVTLYNCQSYPAFVMDLRHQLWRGCPIWFCHSRLLCLSMSFTGSLLAAAAAVWREMSTPLRHSAHSSCSATSQAAASTLHQLWPLLSASRLRSRLASLVDTPSEGD